MVLVSADLGVLGWIWHDAEVLFLNSSWSTDGVLSVLLRCEINLYEDRQPLINLGINTPIINATFYDCGPWSFESPGNYSNRETIDKWLCTQSSNKKSASHLITCSGGSKISIVCTKVHLSSVE